jgi:transcriptional regulator with XRE-family HTH domain
MKKDLTRKPRGLLYDKDTYFLNNLIGVIEGRRSVLRLKQHELAGMSGITQQAYSRWMDPNRGKGNVDVLLFKKLVIALKLTDQEIIDIIRKE